MTHRDAHRRPRRIAHQDKYTASHRHRTRQHRDASADSIAYSIASASRPRIADSTDSTHTMNKHQHASRRANTHRIKHRDVITSASASHRDERDNRHHIDKCGSMHVRRAPERSARRATKTSATARQALRSQGKAHRARRAISAGAAHQRASGTASRETVTDRQTTDRSHRVTDASRQTDRRHRHRIKYQVSDDCDRRQTATSIK
jgi:hypothetical protein